MVAGWGEDCFDEVGSFVLGGHSQLMRTIGVRQQRAVVRIADEEWRRAERMMTSDSFGNEEKSGLWHELTLGEEC